MFLSNLRSKESNILCHPLFFLHLFFIKLSFPLYSQKHFSCPTTPPQPVSSTPLNPIFFFFFPSLFQKKLPAFNAFKQKFFCPISAQLSWLVLIMDDLLVYPFLKPEIPPLERSLLNYPSLKLVDSIFGQIFLRFSFRKILLLRAKTVFPC